MFKRVLALVFTSSLVSISTAAFAFSLDSDGNYTSVSESGGYHISWQVTTGRLNCRKNPGKNEQTIQQYVDGERLIADTNDGQSNPILWDGESKPWLRVKSGNGICYVRARDLYIRPLRSR